MEPSPLEASAPPSPTSSATSSASDILSDTAPSSITEIYEEAHDLQNTGLGANPLVHAIRAADIAQVRFLSQLGHTITAPDGWALYEACIQGPEMTLALMLNPDIDLDQELPGNNGRLIHYLLRTPAMEFIGNKVDVVCLLLLSGVDPFQRDVLGDTALHLLAGPVQVPETQRPVSIHEVQNHECLERESLHLLRYLLARMRRYYIEREEPRPIDITNDYGNTPLVVAVLYNNIDAVEIFLENGASRQIKGELDLYPGKNRIDMDTI